MTQYSSIITLNGVSLNILNCTPRRVQKKLKQTVGKTLVQNDIIGLDVQQWELDITGIVLPTSTSTLSDERALLESLESTTSYAYVDGIHDGNFFVVPGSLTIEDTGEESHSFLRYSIKLIEE